MKILRCDRDILYYDEEKDIKLYDKIKNTCYNIERIFKNDQRSYVALIDIDGQKYVLKRPIEKIVGSGRDFYLYLEGAKVKGSIKIFRE